MAWLDDARRRANRRLEQARKASSAPPFVVDSDVIAPSTPVMMVDASPRDDDGVPRPVRVAGAWSWRIILFCATVYLLLRIVSVLDIVVIPIAVATLLAALFQPLAAKLRDHGVNKSVAAAIVLLGALIVVFGGLGLIINTFVSQLNTLTDQVSDGIQQVQNWLANGPMHISQTQINNAITQIRSQITSNKSWLTTGALTTATTVTEVAAGFLLTLFTLFFFLRDGGQIWRFLCRLLPRPARVPTARAGHYAWHTLVSYVRATVLVAFVDAIGIGTGVAILRVPLALPLGALVFLGAFIPVVGATATGAVAVLVALVTVGPVKALIVLGIVIAVQQLEGHILQPLIMGRAVALHPLAVILTIASGVVIAGIIGGLVAVPILAVMNTAVRYLVHHPGGEPTADREPPGTEPTDESSGEGSFATPDRNEEDNSDAGAEAPTPPADDSSLTPPEQRQQSAQGASQNT